MSKELSSSDRALLHAKERYGPLFEMELRHEAERQTYVEGLTELEQAALVNDADLFSSTNCGWFQYAAMHKAAAEARWRVRAHAEQTAAGTPS